jgi:hypothetical protein
MQQKRKQHYFYFSCGVNSIFIHTYGNGTTLDTEYSILDKKKPILLYLPVSKMHPGYSIDKPVKLPGALFNEPSRIYLHIKTGKNR